jgi:mannosyl-oligosaccharide glucosidase
MGAPSSRALALGAAFLLLLVALPSAFLYLTTSAAPAAATRATLLNLKPFSAKCAPAAAPLRVFMYDLPARFHVAMMGADDGAGFPAWPPSAGGIRRQHSVEYWMMASLQDGAAGPEGGREAVRVRDPDAADAFFVPFFSSLSFNVHGRNMTDPDTEADRLLQVPRLITFTDNFLALYKLLLLQSYVLLLFSVGLIGG